MKSTKLFLALSAVLTMLPSVACAEGPYMKEHVTLRQGKVSLELVAMRTLVDGRDKRRYSVSNLLDGKAATAWVTRYAADDGYYEGDGQLHIRFKQPVYVKSITLRNGYQKSAELFRENQRVKQLTISKMLIGGSGFPPERSYVLADRMGEQTLSLQDGWSAGVNVFKVQELVLRIDGIYPGAKYQDLCLSSLSIKFAGRPGHIPAISWKSLKARLDQQALRTVHGWDWKGLYANHAELLAALLYYAAYGEPEAYARFRSYAPESVAESEVLDADWKPAVEASRKMR